MSIATSNGARSTARLLSRSGGVACQSVRSFASSSKLRLDSPNPSNPGAHASPKSSVHASEIEHFSRLSSKWWDEHGEFGLLHAMNPARIQFLREKLNEVWGYELAQRQVEARKSSASSSSSTSSNSETPASGEQARSPLANLGKTQFLAGLDVADIGCGGGLLSESLARLGARTTGVDASSSNIGIATTHASRDPILSRPHALGGQSLTYLHTTAEDLVAQNRTFDVVCAMEVLEHVNGPADFLRSLDSLVKPGGHLFMSTIARTPLSWFLTIFMAEDILRLVTPGTHTHHQYINPKELIDFFQNDRKWYGTHSGHDLPQRMQFEVRGTAYLPWKGTWSLAASNTSLPGTQECNYFFWARKPLNAA